VAYLLARAADTVADTRLIARADRIAHLCALREEIAASDPARLAGIVGAVAGRQGLPAERELIERLPECLAAYAALPPADGRLVRRVLGTIVEGMAADLARFPGEDEGALAALDTRAELDRYTYLVAGCVGEFWTDVHAAHRPRLRGWDLAGMRELGVRFGKALQLTNVLRDVPRDLRQGRCYLPADDLARLGLTPRDLLDPARSRAARPLLADLIGIALEHYRAGWTYTLAIPRAEPRLRLACAWPLLIGLRTLARLAGAPRWLDPAVAVKVPRADVYAIMARSLGTVWSARALGREARRLDAVVRRAAGVAAPR
jgi:farnesyl-diphosphate farnesyltransferase